MHTANGNRRRGRSAQSPVDETMRERRLLHHRWRHCRWRRKVSTGIGLLVFLHQAVVVHGQYIDGGDVLLDCTRCSCKGSFERSDVMVVDNPSSGQRIASVDGEYAEVAETSCGKSVIAVGSTIYALSGIEELDSRGLEAVDMSPGDCDISGTLPAADCYNGDTSMSLDGGASMTLAICLCIYTDTSSTTYWSQVNANVQGASSVDIPSDEIEICLEGGFVAQMVTAVVDGVTYLYNFDLVVPGVTSSFDLSVASAPDAGAQSFICGEQGEMETDPPVAQATPVPTSEPDPPETPAPIEPETVEPTEEPSASKTESPVTPSTPAPLTPEPADAESPAPRVLETDPPEAKPTDSPVAPTPPPTPSPTKVVLVTGTSAPETLEPAATGTPAPVPAMTTMPNGGGRDVGATAAPTSPGKSLAPSATGDGGGGDARGSSSPTHFDEEGEEGHQVEGQECELPEEASCTSEASAANLDMGIGSFYDPSCRATTSAEGELPGTCIPNSCRPCLFNTRYWQDKNSGEDLPDLVDCPCCVLEVYREDIREVGVRCEGSTPSPAASTSAPSGNPALAVDTLVFEDKSLRIIDAAGFDVGVLAFGILALLTFFPVCAK